MHYISLCIRHGKFAVITRSMQAGCNDEVVLLTLEFVDSRDFCLASGLVFAPTQNNKKKQGSPNVLLVLTQRRLPEQWIP